MNSWRGLLRTDLGFAAIGIIVRKSGRPDLRALLAMTDSLRTHASGIGTSGGSRRIMSDAFSAIMITQALM